MLHLKEVPETNIVELTVDGKVSEEDFMVVTTILENKLKKHKKLKILEEIKSFSGMPLKLWPKDFKFVLSHFNDFEKAAVVTDKLWMKALGKIAGIFSKSEIKFFKKREIRDARVWLAS